MPLYVFDFDGTIADTEAIKIRCFRQLFEQHPLVERIDHFNRRMRGIPRRIKLIQIARQILKLTCSEEEARFIEDCLSRYQQALDIGLRQASLISGVRAFLEQIQDEKRIVSAAPYADVVKVSKNLGVDSYFTVVEGNIGNKGEVLAAYKQSFPQMCYFGDAYADYAAANFAGVPFIGIANDSNQTWLNAEKAFYVHSFQPKPILEFLDRHWSSMQAGS